MRWDFFKGKGPGCSLFQVPYRERGSDWLEVVYYSMVLSCCTMD